MIFAQFNVLSYVLLFVVFFSTSCNFENKTSGKLLRLGYMPNVTHATALVGIEKNIFQDELGVNVKFKPIHFVVGNSIIDAFITNQIDVAYVGPGPFINAVYRKVPIKLLANATNGGTVLVGTIHELPLQKGMRIAIPQYGNTQDLILRSYLEKNTLLDKVKILAIPPQDIGTAFFTMSIDVACVPEPWGTILIKKNICKLLEDEKLIFNNGNYPVTLLVVNKEYEKKNMDLIRRFLNAHKRVNKFIEENPNEATITLTKAISDISKNEIDESIIRESFKRCGFKNELDLNILNIFATIGVKSGYYREGFSFDLNKLNENNIN